MSLPRFDYIPIDSREDLHVLLRRLKHVYSGFDRGDVDQHVEQMRTLDKVLDHNPIRTGERVSELSRGHATLPDRLTIPSRSARHVSVEGGEVGLRELLDHVNTCGIIILHKNQIIFEEYSRGNTAGTRWMTYSASKAVVGMLVAIAHEQRAVDDFHDPVTKYWPELRGGGWDGVTIDHCLRMTTGIDWDEEDLEQHRDSTWTKLSFQLCFGSIDDFLAKRRSRYAPGKRYEYASINTEMLGAVLIRATGMSISRFLEERIWQPAGMEFDAYWVTDPTGREMALSGLCAALRDYARLGLVLANDGFWNGQQIVPKSWVDTLSATDEEIYRTPGFDEDPTLSWYQSMVPSAREDRGSDFMAMGSWGQVIYVNRDKHTVVAAHSIYPDIVTEYADLYRHFMAFRQIAEHLDGGND